MHLDTLRDRLEINLQDCSASSLLRLSTFISTLTMPSSRYSLLPLIFFLTLSHAKPPTSTCPVVLPEPANRIVGGKPSKKGTAQFMVSVLEDSYGICSGTLISRSWVLTAEHCVDEPQSSYSVRVGSTEAYEGELFSVSDIYVPKRPPGNRSTARNRPADIAVLKLSRPVPSSKYTFAILNANDSLPLPRAYTRAIGYGNKRFRSGTYGTLYQVDMQTQSLETCRNESWWWLDDARICTNHPLSNCSICHGDSGGPLIQYDEKGNPVVLGVASMGIECEAKEFSNVHTRVSSYIPWMRSVGARFEASSQPLQVFKEVKGPAAPSLPACPIKIPYLPPVSVKFPSSARLYKGALASGATGRFMVSIYAFRYCTGVLISRTWALTASNCSVTSFDEVFLGGRHPYIGPEARIKRTIKGSHGATLIEFYSTALDTGSVVLVNSDNELPRVGSFARVVSYGEERRYDSSTSSNLLRQIDVPVVDPKQCDVNKTQLSESLCTTPAKGGCAPCSSDLGAPLLQFTDDGQPVIVGIILGGSTCIASSSPTLYTKMSSLVTWMRRSGAVFSINNGGSPQQSVKPSIVPSPLPSGQLRTLSPSVRPSRPSRPSPSSEPSRTLRPLPSSLLTPSASPTPNVNFSPSPHFCREVIPQEPPEEQQFAVRIVGGKLSSANSSRYMVSLRSTDGEQECSGVLLSSRWVLTGRYCSVRTSWMAFVSTKSSSGNFIDIDEVHYAPIRNGNFQFANVTLLKLSEDTPENSTAARVNSNASLPMTSAYGRVLGYGGSAADEGRRLRQVDLPILSSDICRPKFNTSNSLERNIADEMFCAGMTGCGACNGDRGAPLLQFEGTIPVVIGILNGEGPCSSRDTPHSFVRIAGLVSWMESIGVVFSTSSRAEQVYWPSTDLSNGSGRSRLVVLLPLLLGIVGVSLLAGMIGLFVTCLRRQTTPPPEPDVYINPSAPLQV